jgi:hypothetical protein
MQAQIFKEVAFAFSHPAHLIAGLVARLKEIS